MQITRDLNNNYRWLMFVIFFSPGMSKVGFLLYELNIICVCRVSSPKFSDFYTRVVEK